MRRIAAALLLLGALNAAAQQPKARPWMDAKLSVDRRARALLSRMTPEEKFWQLYMAPGDTRRDSAALVHGAFGVQMSERLRGARGDTPRARAALRADEVQRFFVERTRLGIPVIVFAEGLHGLVQDDAEMFPQAIGLAASFDTALMAGVANAIGVESRARGIRMLLSPVVNLARDQRWGRVEETYGEDPWLSAAMGRAFVRGIEHEGVVATPKHFVANHGDGGRDSYPVNVDDATLEDVHLPPFRAAIVDAGARAVMASYNSLNGLPATASPYLLRDILRKRWGFGGVVISDAGAVGGANVLHRTTNDYAQSTARALRAGLDVIFQGDFDSAPLFRAAFEHAMIPGAVIDSAVIRVLRLKFQLGLFDKPYVGRVEYGASSSSSLSALVAPKSLVLLHNPAHLLPLDRSRRRVVVIGEAGAALPSGGYSARRDRPGSVVEQLRLRLGAGADVRHVRGVDGLRAPLRPVPSEALGGGLRGEYFANPAFEGTPAHARTDHDIDFTWTFMPPAPGLGTDWYSVRWTGSIKVPPGPKAVLAAEGDDGYRLWIDDSLVIDAWGKVSYGRHEAPQSLAGGSSHAVRLEYRQTTGTGRIRLLWSRDTADAGETRITEAVEGARAAEIAIVMATIDEGEFRDRSTLRLPGRQEELIARVAATGTPVVVVLVAGSAVITTPWMDHVGAVLWAPYPGDGGAGAIAGTLLGDAPAGRLPFTVPRSDGQLPLVYDHLPTGRGDDYVDLTGQPLFPFGYGLTYTTFAYAGLRLLQGAVTARDTVRARFTLTNTGAVASDEVPQLYVRHQGAPTAQPVLALRAFARVPLPPGESREVELAVPVASLAVRDLDGRRRVVPEDVTIYVGASSRDIRLRGTVHLK